MKFDLSVEPRDFRIADVAQTRISIDVENDSERYIDTEAHQFQLKVNDTASVVFMLSGNRIYSEEWRRLPPGEKLSLDYSSIAPRLFTHVGSYKLQLCWKEESGKVFFVQVLE